ncbi:MAG: indolepyruvate oxidoreductase subunit beta [Clostridia bacterium]|nr:indolepyruvate oxidoreductase subunit beta [Clostridia bacterium]
MKSLNIMIVGVGGQGTLLTSRIIGKTALKAGYDVKISEVHGMAQRGGSVVTFVRFSDKVNEPVVHEGDADILIAFERLEALRYVNYLKKDGIIIVNDCRIDPMPVVIGAEQYPEDIIEKLKQNHQVHAIDGAEIANDLGNSKVLNSVVLGLSAKHIGFEKSEWEEVIKSTVPPKTIDINVLAFNKGYNN